MPVNRHVGRHAVRSRAPGRRAATTAPAGRRDRRAAGRPRRRLRHGRRGKASCREEVHHRPRPPRARPARLPPRRPTGPAAARSPPRAGRPPPPRRRGCPGRAARPRTPPTSPARAGSAAPSPRAAPAPATAWSPTTAQEYALYSDQGWTLVKGARVRALVEPNPLRIHCGPGLHVRLVKFSRSAETAPARLRDRLGTGGGLPRADGDNRHARRPGPGGVTTTPGAPHPA